MQGSPPPKFQTLRASNFRPCLGQLAALLSWSQRASLHFSFLFFGTGPWPAPTAAFCPGPTVYPNRRPFFFLCGYCSTGHFFSIVACLPFLDMRFKWHIYKHPRLVSPIRG